MYMTLQFNVSYNRWYLYSQRYIVPSSYNPVNLWKKLLESETGYNSDL